MQLYSNKFRPGFTALLRDPDEKILETCDHDFVDMKLSDTALERTSSFLQLHDFRFLG